jgi:large subunit ribosomal protein L4
MLKLKVMDINKTDVSEIELDETVFNYPKNEHLVYEAVKNFNANQRQGTHCTKTRKDIKGSNKKLWRQKGTGRSRTSNAKNPIWRSGGTIFGPRPRDYSYSMPKKAKRNALKSVLSDKVRNERLIVLDKFIFENNKTKNTIKFLDTFKVNRTLIVDEKGNENLVLSSRNVAECKVVDFMELNIYDALKYEYIIFSKNAIEGITEKLK